MSNEKKGPLVVVQGRGFILPQLCGQYFLTTIKIPINPVYWKVRGLFFFGGYNGNKVHGLFLSWIMSWLISAPVVYQQTVGDFCKSNSSSEVAALSIHWCQTKIAYIRKSYDLK